MLAFLYQPIVRGFSWLSRGIHRLVTALMVTMVVAVEGGMHLLNLPHLEGWWTPLFGGSAVAVSLGAWLYQSRKKNQTVKTDGV